MNELSTGTNGHASPGQLPPDAAERDATKREEAGLLDEKPIVDDGFIFHTRNVSDEDRAALVAVLTHARTEEMQQVRRVERREHEPWARSQRVPEGIGELLAES